VNLNDGGTYVPVPDVLKVTDKHLQYLDMLTYASMRSFDNPVNGCFAMHETIGKRAGLSKSFIIESVKRLEKAGLITVDRSEKKRVSNHYFFATVDAGFKWSCSQIPTRIFQVADLTSNEKAMLICIRQFYYHGKHTCLYGHKFYAKWLGLSLDTVRKQFSSVIRKGYVIRPQKLVKHGGKSALRYLLSDKLNWDFSHFAKESGSEASFKLMVA
jgi:hypothetical protein